MPKAFPKEFREDVIRVYRDSGSSIAQVAKDFGVSPSCLKRLLVIDERGSTSPASAGQSEELREANKRIRLLELNVCSYQRFRSSELPVGAVRLQLIHRRDRRRVSR